MTNEEKELMKAAIDEAVKEHMPGIVKSELLRLVRQETESVLRRYSRRALVGFVCLVVAALLLYNRQNDENNSTKALAETNANLVQKTTNLAIRIQDSRHENALNACNDLNARHTHTINQLDIVLGEALKHAKTVVERQQIVQSKASTILLINALVPFTDNCKHKADQQVK